MSIGRLRPSRLRSSVRPRFSEEPSLPNLGDQHVGLAIVVHVADRDAHWYPAGEIETQPADTFTENVLRCHRVLVDRGGWSDVVWALPFWQEEKVGSAVAIEIQAMATRTNRLVHQVLSPSPGSSG